MKWIRWTGIILVLAVVVILIVYGYRPQPEMVETAEVGRGPLQVTVEEEGKTRVTDRFIVSAPVAGFARRMKLKVGDPIKGGQLLLQLEPLRSTVLDPRSRAQAEARVATAQASLEAAQEQVRSTSVDLSYWETELARVKELYKSGDVAADRHDRTVTEMHRAEAARRLAEQTVEVARAEVAAARVALDHSAASPANNPAELVEVHAPAGGRVLKVIHESEGVVGLGEPLLEIANSRSLEVEVEVLSADAVQIGPGTKVLFDRWGGDIPLEGIVRKVEPVAFTKISALGVEEQRVLIIADITSPSELWERLGDGYRVEASFILWEQENVPQIPSSALFRYQGGWAVFVVKDGIAQRRMVEVGHQNGLVAELISGLSSGDAVITHPDDSIEEGTLVDVRLTR